MKKGETYTIMAVGVNDKVNPYVQYLCKTEEINGIHGHPFQMNINNG